MPMVNGHRFILTLGLAASGTTRSRGKVRKVRKRTKPVPVTLDPDLRWITEDPKDEYFSRFVIGRTGKQLGESIGIDGKMLIMKRKMKFYSVPLAAIRFEGNDLRVVRKVDWVEARAKGERWKKANL